jgi:hypothetical protein
MIEGRTGGTRSLRGVREGFDLTIFVDGKETDAGATPTITVTRADGTAVATAAATTKPASTTGLYRWTPAAPDVAEVERYTAVWIATVATVAQTFTTRHEIVGGFYCDLQEIRAQEGLEDLGRFPHQRLIDARRWFEDLAETFCGRSFVQRYEREIFSGDGGTVVWLAEQPATVLLAVSIDGVAVTPLTVFDLATSGRLVYEAGFTVGDTNVAVSYVHGQSEPDGTLREAAIEAIADRVRRAVTSLSDRTVSMVTGDGTLNFQLAGSDAPTGLPMVDQVLRDRREAQVAIR